MRKLYFLAALLPLVLQTYAQPKQLNYSLVKPAEWFLEKTDTLDYEQGNFAGTGAFMLKRKIANYKSASVGYPKSLKCRDCIIELDIACPAGKNGFVGFAFHIQDAHHYECLYFRPGSSGTINAVQYMPEKKPEFDWWDYEADKYQSTATLPETGWFHVKAIVKGSNLQVFLNGGQTPVMTRNDLDPSLKTGSVGFWLGNCFAGAYKNLKVQVLD